MKREAKTPGIISAALVTILLGLARPSVAQQPGWGRGFDALMDSPGYDDLLKTL